MVLTAGDLHWFKDFNISDEVSPVNFQDGVEAVLMEILKEAYVESVSDPELSPNKSVVSTTAL